MAGLPITLGNKTFMLEAKMVKKLDLLIKRVTNDKNRQDSTLGINGRTGTGKTNAALIFAGYVSQKTGRPINLFFTSNSTLEFAQRTEGQLIILDEPSLDMMARDWASKTAKDFLRLTNTMRRKRHFFIINLVGFWHFPQDLIVDRLNALVHMYLKQDDTPGKFLYIRQRKLESLWNDYKKLNRRRFFHYKSFRGDVPYIMEDGTLELLDINIEGKPHATYYDYEHLKDIAIQGISKQDVKKDKNLMKLLELRRRIGLVNCGKLGITKVSLGIALGINQKLFSEWSKIDLENPNILGNDGLQASSSSPLIISRDVVPKIVPDDDTEEDIDEEEPNNIEENEEEEL